MSGCLRQVLLYPQLSTGSTQENILLVMGIIGEQVNLFQGNELKFKLNWNICANT